MVKKTLKAQIVGNSLSAVAAKAREKFFNAKKDGFEYRFPLKSLLPLNRVPEVAFSTMELSGRKFPKVTWL